MREMRLDLRFAGLACAALLLLPAITTGDEQRHQDFNTDPHWEGRNNRTDKVPCRTTSQDFGYSAATAHAGGAPGEIGGTIQTAADLAYYAVRLPRPMTFNDRLSASGKVAFTGGRAPFLAGFFNAENSIGWRTRNSLAMRLDNRGQVFHAHIEYATDRWRAGGEFIGAVDPATGRKTMKEFPLAGVHHWSFVYDPGANAGGGAVIFTLDDRHVVMNLDPGHKADGAVFDRFGLFNVMKSSDDQVTVYLDDLTINGHKEGFSRDPGWDQRGNRRTFNDCVVRPRFDFGWSRTNFAGGSPGELGGVVFRGDDRRPHTMASYADRLNPLTLEAPLIASGRVCLVRGISDSTTLLGWFHSQDSVAPGRSDLALPRGFLGIMVEGPSSEGFLFRPACCSARGQASAVARRGPRIEPDSRPHRWSLRYDPHANHGNGKVAVTLDEESTTLDLGRECRSNGPRFDRFGIITTHIDGNYQFIYFDDLVYTATQSPPSPATRASAPSAPKSP